MKVRRSYFEAWYWKPRTACVVSAALSVVFVPAAIALYLTQGLSGLVLLVSVILGPLVFLVVFGTMGWRLAVLRQSLESSDGVLLGGLIVNGLLQSPGFIALSPDALRLAPLAGSRLNVPYSEIVSVRETNWFNGSLLVFKTGFWLNVRGYGRIGVAVENSDAERLRARLDSSCDFGK